MAAKLCGSQDGVLVIFTWSSWGDVSDRIPGHPDSVEALLKVDGRYGTDWIKCRDRSATTWISCRNIKVFARQSIIGSTSHTNKVHFWDVGYLFELDDDVEVDNGDMNEEKGSSSVTVDTEMQEADSHSDIDDSDMGNALEDAEYLIRPRKTYFSTLSRLSCEFIPNYLY
ncbi:hypothetical protein PsorP6_014459 [Peronosclerospora sorghi]|uniref:Uncharacterized protein n=1 Tax=Peronosclerospora sorghi TaxID=230839 RepID=A0ACC0VST1_9STRA|nr:hypothetical protein PsorP6_014459 [Peronosclerospora sorghi]